MQGMLKAGVLLVAIGCATGVCVLGLSLFALHEFLTGVACTVSLVIVFIGIVLVVTSDDGRD